MKINNSMCNFPSGRMNQWRFICSDHTSTLNFTQIINKFQFRNYFTIEKNQCLKLKLLYYAAVNVAKNAVFVVPFNQQTEWMVLLFSSFSYFNSLFAVADIFLCAFRLFTRVFLCSPFRCDRETERERDNFFLKYCVDFFTQSKHFNGWHRLIGLPAINERKKLHTHSYQFSVWKQKSNKLKCDFKKRFIFPFFCSSNWHAAY